VIMMLGASSRRFILLMPFGICRYLLGKGGGGNELQSYLFYKLLLRNKIKVSVFMPVDLIFKKEVKFISEKIGSDVYPFYALLRPGIGYLSVNLMLLIHVLKRADEIRGAEVISFGTQYALPLFLLRKLFRGLYVRVSGLDVNLSYHSITSKLTLTLGNKVLFRCSNKIICPTLQLKQATQTFVKQRDKLVVIPNLTDIRANQKRDAVITSNTILYVGRFEREKGIKTLLHAFRNVVNKGFDIKLFLIGDGSLMTWIRTFIRKNNLNDKVITTGFLKQLKVYEFMRRGGIFVLPSLTEGMSNSLLQAMAMGLPIIVTNAEGNSELIENEKNGLIIPVGSAKKLSEAITIFLKDPKLAIRLGVSAKETVEKKMEDAEDLYLRLIS